MKTSLFILTELQQLTSGEMLNIRGGRRMFGPGDTMTDDIDMPDLTALPDPGDTLTDDIDMPDITLGSGRLHRRTGRTYQNPLFF
ncbi:MAG: hypothetical protein PHD61_08330 [Bacteroidales bacterium]|nr:hypothetical protein [Lentimicrobiaceae bacterium]MDD5695297.1 hypothetical protein [Bacteroidales bacterium]